MCAMAEAAGNLVSVAIAEATRMLGYKQLKTEQEQVIMEFVKGKDVFVSLPTGSGKSLCFRTTCYTNRFHLDLSID